MAINKMTKINQVLLSQPDRVVWLASWLEKAGISRSLQEHYRKAAWFEPIGTGAYKRTGQKINWEAGIYALQKQALLPIHIGALTALETWLKIDEKKLYAEWNSRIDRIRKLVDTVPGVKTDVYVHEDGNRYPTLKVSWDQDAWKFSISDCVQQLRASNPVIEVLGGDNPSLVTAVHEGNPKAAVKDRKAPDHIELVSMTIKPGEEIIVGQRLRAVLRAAQQGKPAA